MKTNNCKGCEGNAIGYPHNHPIDTTPTIRAFFCDDCGVFTAKVPTHIRSARCQCGQRCREASDTERALFHALNAF